MIVAFGATHGAAKPDRAKSADAVGAVFRQILFRLEAALGGRPAGVYTRAVLAITAITVIAGALAALGALRRTHRTA